ncbi:MAG TPA: bifunctional [glutamate--ammonia ligase]-adenylyl-L-tyrosine phosphorylase/[glutamate--ammonia-ligase] adenylyltransferase, partial [Psychromonas hadalis]|nr:bifunctional [glutamate--ammonia ligase]-adenylyl-L-tyrosine phosphorylase/[glutamate--ammonia-ligase] adenylyltransferase [Psychromonas hadalis]
IDLIFTYPERGQTEGARRCIDNQPFFIKLAQRLITALHQITIDGFAYRVDMRLRPFGESGPLVSTFASFEDYYQSHGREWERYAMVKARVMGEEGAYKIELENMLKPFVFRRYIDFSAIDSLRKMKGMISAEVRRKGLKDNIKLGKGGIREIEFVAQAFQLVRGGRAPQLQCKGLLQTLDTLAEMGELSEARAQSLTDSYHFLRRVENILQQIGDKQTQTLPNNELDKQRLMAVMKFDSWALFYDRLNSVMEAVHDAFNWVIGENEDQSETQEDQSYKELWLVELSEQEMMVLLQDKSIADETARLFSLQLLNMKEEMQKRPIGPRGKETIDKLIPKILEKSLTYQQPVALIKRLHQLLSKIATRTAYLELLHENEGALNQLLKLCHASARISEQLARYPILLDELLDPQQLYNPLPLTQYKTELRQFMLRIPEEDMEQQMEALRQFMQMQFLHISAADIVKAIELTKVSDHLTFLSEALMDYVVQIAWTQMVEKFGTPSNVIGTDRKGFAVIGYGKMGGFELGYSSDLDVVFLHDSDIKGSTDGARPIDNQRFYFRLVQRIIHLFSARTNSGRLYEIDLRLRPSGNSGLLASSVSGYLNYLQNDAWTWEHQALVRTRAVYFDDQILAEFQQARQAVLSEAREDKKLKTEIVDMRQKMRDHLNKAKTGEFDLKQSSGGMVDIEFIAQYLVLTNAHQFPHELCLWSDNLRVFETCKKLGLISENDETALVSAYCHIRDAAHRLTLNQQTRIVSDAEFKNERAAVIKIWARLLG